MRGGKKKKEEKKETSKSANRKMQCVSKKAYRFPIRYYGIKLWVIPSHFHLSKSKYQISSRANNSFPYDRPGITPIISNIFFSFFRSKLAVKEFSYPAHANWQLYREKCENALTDTLDSFDRAGILKSSTNVCNF